MARVVKRAEVRQDEILDAAQRLFLQQGYEATSIQSVIDAVGIAKGTFYHHYPSKTAVMHALVERMVTQSLALVHAVAATSQGTAIDRLNAIFLEAGAWKADRRALLIEVNRALRTEGNAVFQARIQRESMAAMVPVVEGVIRQGVQEGCFDAPFPEATARMVVELGICLSELIGDVVLGEATLSQGIALPVNAYHDAVGRLLGAPPGSIRLVDLDLLTQWLPQ